MTEESWCQTGQHATRLAQHMYCKPCAVCAAHTHCLISISNGGQWVRGLSACQLHAFLLDEQTTKALPRRRTTRQLAQIRLIEHLLFIRCVLKQHPQ